MAKPAKDVTDAELAVLQLLWKDQAPATIRKLTQELYSDASATRYATVQKLLERLENKGYVRRLRQSVPQQFQATLSREQLLSQRLRAMADSLCEGSLAPLLTQLIHSKPLTRRQIDELRRLIDRFDSPSQRRER